MAQLDVRHATRIGLIAGIVAVSVSAIGMVEAFDKRDIITGFFTLGQLLLFAAPAIGGYMAARPLTHSPNTSGHIIVTGLVSGLWAGITLAALLLLTLLFPTIRQYFVNISPALIEILAFGQGQITGIILQIVLSVLLGTVGAGFHLLPQMAQRPLLYAIGTVLSFGIFSDIPLNIIREVADTTPRSLFGTKGITLLLAIILFVVVLVSVLWWNHNGRSNWQTRRANLNPKQETLARRLGLGAISLGLLFLPLVLGTYLTEVVDNVGLYILMGLGLNIVVGFAGLLDLGYVAFFAIGAYMMGILTSTGPLGGAEMSFWVALPICVATAVVAGLILGVPVLRMRGDYLAIVTLGFGEIIRVLATSDLLKGTIGGAQGILQIPKPQAFGQLLVQPQQAYYIILVGCALAVFISWRLRDSRLGRRWMALREDEDVAEAMGINLVIIKLLAFGIGAGFSGLAGAIFAARIGSIFPHSFNLNISINVLSLIIVGGLGSLPGVVVGAIVLVGLPEILREFAEYRLLMYGALLIAMMLARPEGLWPSAVMQRELHADDVTDIPDDVDTLPETA